MKTPSKAELVNVILREYNDTGGNPDILSTPYILATAHNVQVSVLGLDSRYHEMCEEAEALLHEAQNDGQIIYCGGWSVTHTQAARRNNGDTTR